MMEITGTPLFIPSMSQVLSVVFLISVIAWSHTKGVHAEDVFRLLFMFFLFSALDWLRIITLPYEEKKYSGIKLPSAQ